MLRLLVLFFLSTAGIENNFFNIQKCKISIEQVKRANFSLDLVSQMAPEQVHFDHLSEEEHLFQSSISTASAIHFARAYLDATESEVLESARQAITSVKKHRLLPAIQAVMNTAKPSHPFVDTDSYVFNYQKMQAYLSFEYLEIEESYPPFYSAYLHPSLLKDWINGLKEGIYVIQFSTPHTMVLIKEPGVHFIYDTSQGCLAFFNNDDPSEYLMEAVALQLIGTTSCYKIASL